MHPPNRAAWEHQEPSYLGGGAGSGGMEAGERTERTEFLQISPAPQAPAPTPKLGGKQGRKTMGEMMEPWLGSQLRSASSFLWELEQVPSLVLGAEELICNEGPPGARTMPFSHQVLTPNYTRQGSMIL